MVRNSEVDSAVQYFLMEVRPLGKIGHENGVHHSLLEWKNCEIFIGTGRSIFEPVRLTKGFLIEIEGIEEQLWRDVQTHFEGYEGGQIVYDHRRVYQFDTMAIGIDGTVFCGKSNRGGKFFCYNIDENMTFI